jgi:uncharacterized protein YndB with AHSA1/START domain
MTERSVTHATFCIERVYDAQPARVFAAWADPKAKAAWFTGQASPDYSLDFRVGGREVTRGGSPGGAVYGYEATYQDIVTDQRIVYAYVMDKDGARISASVTTVEFEPAGGGTRVRLTEQGVYLDGGDKPEIRQGGIEAQFDALGAALSRANA